MKSSMKWIIGAVIGILVLCMCLIIGGFTAWGVVKLYGSNQPTPAVINNPPESGAALQTLDTLENTIVPESDLRKLAVQLKGVANVPETLPAPAEPFLVGDTQSFWVTNVDSNESFQVHTTLRAERAHAYFWIENGLQYDEEELTRLIDAFENKIYPTDREFFGSEWTPGIDNDPHIYIVLAKNLGNSLAGYFSSADEVPPVAHKFSNGHEMILMNADNIDLGDPFTYGVLAHEFQHMIHWFRDKNEESWLNEGFSELAAFLNGYDVGGFDFLYTQNPNLQLNDWPNDPSATSPHYGAGFLFLDYFLDRFGAKATQALVADPANGLDSIDGTLATLGVKDNLTEQPIKADDVFTDWTVASLLNDSSVGDGRYAYHNYPEVSQPSVDQTISKCPQNWSNQSVHQYGVEYFKITCPGNFTLNFSGTTEIGVLPVNAHSGNYAFWSNKGDESDMTLTQTFDFTRLSGPIAINYWTWYDLEKDYDYVYLEASEDGQHWTTLKTPSSTQKNISGNNYGWGYNNVSNKWIQEQMDLSQYAGKQVQLRFEYITDAAVNGEGFLLDDVSIPAINYHTDFENNDGGWQAAGFVRIQNRLPQTYRVTLITQGKTTTVETPALNADQTLSLPLQIGGDVKDVILVVSGTTRFTRQEAPFRFEVVKK